MIKVGEKIGSLKRISRKKIRGLLKEKKTFYTIPKDDYSESLTEEQIKRWGEQPNYKEFDFSDLDECMNIYYDIFAEGYDDKELIFMED